ncbi:hypothetical protein SAMN04489712_12093 [Thermomonospora echinospora]|uniref:Nucleotidyltransferase n=1 Tax=Thermomonospora echinospora TaxID=1992 RepID=A0A1H6DPD5_9ACTN|nr:hypothetical protein [Thermomonospora echinospora]SEG87227.1 hypothetical protein SAMN04489712_12093 [Thermomonospora echinospora]
MPINRCELFEILEDLGLPQEDYVVAGSAPLLVHGLRESINDVDVVARGAAWAAAAARGRVESAPYDRVRAVFLHGGEVEVLDGWFPETLGWKVDRLIDEADVVDGFRFLSVERTLEWKELLGRDKDDADLRSARRDGETPAGRGRSGRQ